MPFTFVTLGNPDRTAQFGAEQIIIGNVSLFEYGGLVWLFFHLVVLIYEEPTLTASFGSDYAAFCAEVPRWIPRLTPWTAHPDV